MGDPFVRRVIGDVLVDGEPMAARDAGVSVLDIGVQRGFGCFEVLRSYAGKPFRARAHIDRLAAGAAKLGIELPEAGLLESWIGDTAASGGDCAIRVIVTGGVDPARPGVESSVFVLAEPLPDRPGGIRLLPVEAPWHSDGVPSELTGVKTLSYGPNLAASLAAQAKGFDDALLVGRSGSVLEGPTYGIGWFRDDRLETPALDLGILASITRTAMLDIATDVGVSVAEGRFSLEQLLAADEVFVLSTVKEFLPAIAVGDRPFEPGPLTARLASGFADLVRAELSDG